MLDHELDHAAACAEGGDLDPDELWDVGLGAGTKFENHVGGSKVSILVSNSKVGVVDTLDLKCGEAGRRPRLHLPSTAWIFRHLRGLSRTTPFHDI